MGKKQRAWSQEQKNKNPLHMCFAVDGNVTGSYWDAVAARRMAPMVANPQTANQIGLMLTENRITMDCMPDGLRTTIYMAETIDNCTVTYNLGCRDNKVGAANDPILGDDRVIQVGINTPTGWRRHSLHALYGSADDIARLRLLLVMSVAHSHTGQKADYAADHADRKAAEIMAHTPGCLSVTVNSIGDLDGLILMRVHCIASIMLREMRERKATRYPSGSSKDKNEVAVLTGGEIQDLSAFTDRLQKEQQRRMEAEAREELENLFFAINQYVSTGDHIAEGVAEDYGDKIKLLLPYDPCSQFDSDDHQKFRSRVTEIIHKSGLQMDLCFGEKFGKFDVWTLLVCKEDVKALTRELTRDCGDVGWGSQKSMMDGIMLYRPHRNK